MITNNDKLLVFEEFQSDWKLPKYARKDDASSEDSGTYVMKTNHTLRPGGNDFMVVTGMAPVRKPSWLKRLFRWFFALFDPMLRPRAPELISIEDFFSSVKNSAKELELIKERAAGYEKALQRAKQGGQQAYLEQLTEGLNAYKMESQLLALEQPRYLEEADLIRFYKQSKKGMRLDWVLNFTRPIPEAVLAKKVRADEIGIFDNYAVLHYDPGAKSYAETQAQKDAKKQPRDPILFGLMKGRRRLYYVGDWIDEFCDLTLDQIADALGKDVVKEISPI